MRNLLLVLILSSCGLSLEEERCQKAIDTFEEYINSCNMREAFSAFNDVENSCLKCSTQFCLDQVKDRLDPLIEKLDAC